MPTTVFTMKEEFLNNIHAIEQRYKWWKNLSTGKVKTDLRKLCMFKGN